MIKPHHLLTDEQRQALLAKVHRLNVKRLVIGAIFIGIGAALPEFHHHEVLHVVAADTIKSIGFIPILRIFEGLI